MPRSGCSALHRVNPNEQKKKKNETLFKGTMMLWESFTQSVTFLG